MNPFVLFLLFAKFGCVSFGGGYVLIPLIIHELVEKRGVINMETFGNLVSIAQVTPGPVGMNAATYVGYLQGGFWGALFASLGLIAPSLLLGSLAFYSISRWRENVWVRGILQGVRPVSLAMIFFAAFLFLGMSVFTAPIPWSDLLKTLIGQGAGLPENFRVSFGGLVICAVVVILFLKTKISTTVLILLSAIAGAFLCR